ncbi:MAG: 1-acyl-sn-glycerol-3-phosphate acyltransferase [Flavobacteriaceae bacterium]
MGLPSFLFKKILGWKIEGNFDPSIKKAVVIVAPHTSWHDFFVGLYARRILKTKIHWLGKKELFIWPFSYYFKWTGGTPLDRTSGQNKVEAIADIFKSKNEFRLAMAPEGTRKKVATWKTGFYYIAEGAKVPIIPVAFDYGTKTVKVGKPFYTANTIENDVPVLRSFYDGVKGKKY